MAVITRPAGAGMQQRSSLAIWSWFFMRISGLVLLFMAVFHLLWLHFAVGLESINMTSIVARWDNPLWRLYDMFLLWFALIHGFNGALWVVEDWITSSGWRVLVKSVVYVLAFALIVMGSYIIFTFPMGGPPNMVR